MKYFIKLIEKARADGVISKPTGQDLKKRDVGPEFWNLIEKCQNFVFSPININPIELINENTTIYKKLDAPFQVFSIEMIDGPISSPHEFNPFVSGDPSQGLKVWVWCIMGWEIAPKQFNFIGLVQVEDTLHGDKPYYVLSSPKFDSLAEQFLMRINNERLGLESVKERIRISSGVNKRLHTIRKIIHVCPKRQVESYIPLTNKQVDWTHRFLVRGHWRDLKPDQLGKDREGLYTVSGMTWVNEHEKGPEDKPLIKKVRFIHE